MIAWHRRASSVRRAARGSSAGLACWQAAGSCRPRQCRAVDDRRPDVQRRARRHAPGRRERHRHARRSDHPARGDQRRRAGRPGRPQRPHRPSRRLAGAGLPQPLGGQDRRQPGPVGLGRVRSGAPAHPSISRASTPTASRSTSRRASPGSRRPTGSRRRCRTTSPSIASASMAAPSIRNICASTSTSSTSTAAAVFYLVQQPIVLLAWHDRPDAPRWLSSLGEMSHVE